MTFALSTETEHAYDRLAPVYDLLTGHYRHDPWLAAVERLAREHGLRGRRLLDVACGTGRSFLPMLERGYSVTACDASAGMLARARTCAGECARLHLADMRALPRLGCFDLITCLDDAVNHLLTEDELVAALGGMRDNLAEDGLLVFDVNTLAAYRTGADIVASDGERLVVFWASRAADIELGGTADVAIESFIHCSGDCWRRTVSTHRHRHYPLADLRGCLTEAGLELTAVRGQQPGAVLRPEADETRDPKLVLVARRARPSR